MIKIGFFGEKIDMENSKRGILFIGSPGSILSILRKAKFGAYFPLALKSEHCPDFWGS